MLEKVTYTMFSLILLYLVVKNAAAVNATLNAVSTAANNQITALQGR